MEAVRLSTKLELLEVPKKIRVVEEGLGVVHVGVGDGLWSVGLALALKEVRVEGQHEAAEDKGGEGAAHRASLCNTLVLDELVEGTVVTFDPAVVGFFVQEVKVGN